MKYLVLSALLLSSFSAFAAPTIVLGEDTRIEITDAKARSTHNSIGLLIMAYGKESGVCTGTIVGPKSVITAAHCLYDEKTGKMTTEVVFIPGLRSKLPVKKLPYGQFKASKIRILSNYKKTLSNADDLGLVTFSENLPFKAIPLTTASDFDKNIVIAGYPADKNLGELWEGKGNRKELFMFKVLDQYNVDTFSGQSGSSIRTNRLTTEVVIGVHSGARNGAYNVGFFFNRDTLAAVKRWIEEDK